MKFSCALILGFCLSPLMAADPGKAALNFLGKVKDGKLDLQAGGDTALLEQITEAKRESIRKGIARLREELRDVELELGEVKEDGEFAAAIVHKSGGFDSTLARIFPVALVKRGDEWLAAPVLASFENAVAGYTLPIRERLNVLENWMMHTRVTALNRLISESAMKMRELIRKSLNSHDLEGNDLGKITERFLEACAKSDQAAILGFLGGLSDPLPADWAERIKASKAAVRNQGVWRELVFPEVVRVTVQEDHDTNDGSVLIACLDPKFADRLGITGVKLGFSRDGAGQWRIDLPDTVLNGGKFPEEDFGDEAFLTFAKKLRKQNSALYSDSARAAESALRTALKSGGLRETLRRTDLGAHSSEGTKACVQAAALWWTLNEPGAFRIPIELGFKETGSVVVFNYQWFSFADPDRFERRSLFFRKTDAGWVWCPGAIPKSLKQEYEGLSKWIETMEPQWNLSWREAMLRPSVKLEGIDFGKLPSDEDAKTLVDKWLQALGNKDLGAALACSAWFGDRQGDPKFALRNIGYELSGTDRVKLELLKLHRSDSWVAAIIRRTSEAKAVDAFLPIVMTPNGARILPEIDLIADDSRTRSFLNKAAFGRLRKNVPEKFVVDLQQLFEKSLRDNK